MKHTVNNFKHCRLLREQTKALYEGGFQISQKKALLDRQGFVFLFDFEQQ